MSEAGEQPSLVTEDANSQQQPPPSKRRRIPIPSPPLPQPAAASEEPQDDAAAAHRHQPNSAFLGRYVAGVERGNQRASVETACKAGLQMLGQGAAAAARPALQRAASKDSDGDEATAAVRRAALEAAEAQRFAACAALLKEVAAVYGFRLHTSLDPPDPVADLGAAAAAGATATSQGEQGAAALGPARHKDDGEDMNGASLDRCLPAALYARLQRRDEEGDASPERGVGPRRREPASAAPGSGRIAAAALGALGMPITRGASPSRPAAGETTGTAAAAVAVDEAAMEEGEVAGQGPASAAAALPDAIARRLTVLKEREGGDAPAAAAGAALAQAGAAPEEAVPRSVKQRLAVLLGREPAEMAPATVGAAGVAAAQTSSAGQAPKFLNSSRPAARAKHAAARRAMAGEDGAIAGAGSEQQQEEEHEQQQQEEVNGSPQEEVRIGGSRRGLKQGLESLEGKQPMEGQERKKVQRGGLFGAALASVQQAGGRSGSGNR